MRTVVDCVSSFIPLLSTEYEIVLGRKNVAVKLIITFDKKDCFHLMGLQYLTDRPELRRDRGKIFDEIQNGIVIDHIKAGTAIGLMDLLGIKGNRTSSVALIQNARSHKAESGRKDIIKVEGDASWLNLDVLAYLDPDISVTVIENGKAVKKEKPQPPKRLVNIVRCKNPRCISSIEEECDQIFELSSNGKYRCIYCEQELQVKPE